MQNDTLKVRIEKLIETFNLPCTVKDVWEMSPSGELAPVFEWIDQGETLLQALKDSGQTTEEIKKKCKTTPSSK